MSIESRHNTIILQLLFSGFSYPQESRFIKNFPKQKITSEILPQKKSNTKSLNIETVNIENGKDKRTTIILKNLPNDITKEELKIIIEPLGNINFIYIPLLIKNKNKFINNSPCAYINVINYKTILKILSKFNELKIKSNNINNVNCSVCDKDYSKIEIFYSGTQGKKALINRFRLEKKYLPPNQIISFS